MNKFIYVLIVSISILFCVATLAICIVKEQEIREAQRTQSFGIPEYQLTDEITKAGCFRIHKHNGLTIHYERKMRLI